jgi:hypothetical protein
MCQCFTFHIKLHIGRVQFTDIVVRLMENTQQSAESPNTTPEIQYRYVVRQKQLSVPCSLLSISENHNCKVKWLFEPTVRYWVETI